MSPLVLVPILCISVGLLVRARERAAWRQVYFLKPLSTLLVILVAALSLGVPESRPVYTALVLAGLALSLGGDVALMWPDRARWFLAGLVLFLLAHVDYAIAFSVGNGFRSNDALVGAALLFPALAVFAYLQPGLGRMRWPVLIYVLAITFMVSRALSTFLGPAFAPLQAWAVSLGAILFWLSDAALAVNRFRARLPSEHRIVLSLYYGGQLLIALSPSLGGGFGSLLR